VVVVEGVGLGGWGPGDAGPAMLGFQSKATATVKSFVCLFIAKVC